ncbi:hypothetical protein [Streptomyces sp. NPDC097610]|uniref:hypothetical protein n=1 Tax=Streptomyces sp. NPDC097610 TaxID=3157227 RepID=UPI003329FA8D
MFQDPSGPCTLEVARRIMDAAGELGIHVVTATTGRRSISQWFQECVALGTTGLIIVISIVAKENQRRNVEQWPPVVRVDPLSPPSSDRRARTGTGPRWRILNGSPASASSRRKPS